MKAIHFSRFHYRGRVCGFYRGNKGDYVAQEDIKIFIGKIGASNFILIDNISTIQLAKNPKFHDQIKHINTKYHLI